MNLKKISLASLGVAMLFTSCGNDTEYDYTTASRDAQISSFALAGVHDKTLDSVDRAQDSLRFIVLGKTKFAIDQINNVIYNPDSLPYGFTPKKLLATVNYAARPMSATVDLKGALVSGINDTSYVWNGTDSINFAYKNIYFEVKAADNNTLKRYKVDLRVHKIEHDKIEWNKTSSLPQYVSERKSQAFGGKIYSMAKLLDGNIALHIVTETSKYPVQGQVISKTVSGLPADVDVNSFIQVKNKFYVLNHSGLVFESMDAETWTSVSTPKTVKTILGEIPMGSSTDSRIAFVFENSGSLYLGETVDFSTINSELAMPSDFPVERFSSLVNESEYSSRRMLSLAGGVSASSQDLSAVWWMQIQNGKLAVSKTKSFEFFAGSDCSLMNYDNKFYLLAKGVFYTSDDWGATWTEAVEKQQLPEVLKSKVDFSVVSNNNTIWILGGKSETDPYLGADIWTGTLNKLK